MAKTLAQLADELAPAARKAFLEAIAAIRSDVTLARIEAAIQRGDVAAALDALNLEASYFRPLDDLLRQAVLQGGDYAIDELKRLAPRNTVTGRFDATSPTAADILARYSSGRVVEISETTRDGLRLALSTAMETDAAPRKVTLDLVGRINRVTGRREGGLVGLNSQRIAWAQAAQAELQSGDPAQLANYLTRKSRDARFDPTVRAAIRAGKPVPADKVQAAMRAMNNRLLRDRGETIARTELLGSLHAGQDAGLQQAIARGQLRADQIVRVWDSSGDRFTRPDHKEMDRQERKFGEAFISPSGAMMMYPGDTSINAQAHDVINCRCHTVIKLDLIKGLREEFTAKERAEILAML